jgi:uncharacterized phage-like protein YoqJ
MKIGIVGSRNFNDWYILSMIIDYFTDKLIATRTISEITIVSGGAKGTDTLAKKYAYERNYGFKEFLPKFKIDKNIKYHPKYFMERNTEIVEFCDCIYIFWDGKSSGTRDVIKKCEKFNVDYRIMRIDKKTEITKIIEEILNEYRREW